jgi:hypothetical protein
MYGSSQGSIGIVREMCSFGNALAGVVALGHYFGMEKRRASPSNHVGRT